MTTTLFRGTAILTLLLVSACANKEADKQRYFESGNQFLAEKKYQEAIVQYRNAVQIDERFGEARYKLAEAYTGAGNVRNAFREYVRAADLLPDNVEVQLKTTSMLALAGQFEDAKTRVERVLAKDPRNVPAQILLGNVLAGLKDLGGAISQIEEAIQIEPTRGASYTNLGILRLAQGNRDAARAAFDKAIDVDPKSVQARLALAIFLLQTGEAGPAEQALQSALAIDPKDAMSNRAMAALYLVTKRQPEAERYLKALVEAVPSPETSFMLVDYYVAMKRDAEAKDVLLPLTKQTATAADADVRLAQIEYTTDRPGATARLDGVLTRSPQHVQALVTKARWLLAEGKRDEALARAQAATKAAPDNPTAHYVLGLAQAQLKDNVSAVASFNEVLRLNPRVAAAQLQLSRLQLAQGATAEAVQLAESALRNAPGSAEAKLTLAGGLLAQRDVARADPLIDELLKSYPNVSAAHALDGLRQLLKKNYSAARTSYERAVQLEPRSFAGISGLVAIDMVEKKTDAAQTRVVAALAAAPNDARVLLLASRVYLAVNDQAKAEQSLKRAIEVSPGDSTAYSMLGQLYVAQQKLPEARNEFDAVAARNPKNVGARTAAAMLSHQVNNIDDAKRRYREILDLDATAAVAANNLAWILAEEGKDLDEALRLAERAANAAPNRAEIHDTVGWIYYRKELPALAIPPFEKSVSQSPDNPIYHYHLALAYAKSGNVDQARRALEIALKLKPDYREALELQATLRG